MVSPLFLFSSQGLPSNLKSFMIIHRNGTMFFLVLKKNYYNFYQNYIKSSFFFWKSRHFPYYANPSHTSTWNRLER